MVFETIDHVVKAKSENSSINYKLVRHNVENVRIYSHDSHTFLTKISWNQSFHETSYRCKEISIHLFSISSSNTSASKFDEIIDFDRFMNFIHRNWYFRSQKAQIYLNVSNQTVFAKNFKFWGRYIGRWFLKSMDTYFLTPVRDINSLTK